MGRQYWPANRIRRERLSVATTWKPDAQHKQLAASLLVSNAALRRTLTEIYYLKGADGEHWLSDFEQQLLTDAPSTLDGGHTSDQELQDVKAAIAIMVRVVFEAVRSELAEREDRFSRLAG